MPKLSLSVSGDGLGAKLRIEGFTADAWRAEWAGPSGLEGPGKLKGFLISQGIAEERIREDILTWICQTLTYAPDPALAKDLEAVQDVDLAQGLDPVHEEPQGLLFHHSYLSNAEAISDLRRKVDAWGFGGIRESIDPAYWVASGETVLSFQGISKGQPGCDVFGSPIPFMVLRDRLPPFGKSLFLKDKKLIAVCEGALIVESGQLKVLGSDSLPTCQVVVAEDGMSANLVLGGNYLNDWTVTPDMVQNALREQGVMCMLPEPEIQAALNRFNQDHLPLTLLISRGRPPVPGREGRLSLLVDPEPEVPLPASDGSIDFKDFSFFRTVPSGARLAQVLPPSPGESGMDVFGGAIAAPVARPFGSGPGRNTALEGLDPLFIVSTKPGRLAIRMGVPEVVEVLDVGGDVSLKTGNIEFPGAVKVAGDVHSKMQIHSAGDVEVIGTVENSVIRSDGAIVIRGGVNGLGSGIIKSRLSSVTIGYLHNQRIESHSHIVVFNEIINSLLLARKTIQMRFGKYAVLGGHLLAGEGMDLFNVGSEAGSKAILEVGKDFEVEAEMAGKSAGLARNIEDLEFLRDMDDQLTGILRLRRTGNDEETLLRKRTQGAMEILDRWIADLRKDLGDLAKRLYLHEPCTILIRGVAHPGTVLKYHDDVVVVSKAVTNRKWVFRDKGALPPPEGQAI
ncbi:MAG: Flagellar Assembly Protein [Fibrobacteres bacterium]|nr:Flagellar Assembly Protein [Fibrobacterota bacterium]